MVFGLQILTYPARKAISWKRPPGRDTRVSSNLVAGNGVRVTASFRVMCALQAVMTQAPKALGYELHIITPPYTPTEIAPLSAGTHDLDDLFDLVPVGGIQSLEQGYKLQNWLRRHGWFVWFRHTGTWAAKSRWHIHGGPLPVDGKNFTVPVGEYVDGGLSTQGRLVTSSQIMDYWNHSLGLKGQHASGLDKAPSKFPKDIMATVFDLPAYIEKKRAELPPPKPKGKAA